MTRTEMQAELLIALDNVLKSPTWNAEPNVRDVRDTIKEGFQFYGETVDKAAVRAGLVALVENAADVDLAWMVRELRAP